MRPSSKARYVSNEMISSRSRDELFAVSFEQTLSSRALIANPLKIVQELETWNNFPVFKPCSTLRCRANRCDDNSLILENYHSTGAARKLFRVYPPPSLSRQTLTNATLSPASIILARVLVKADLEISAVRASDPRDSDEKLNVGKNGRWNFMKEISRDWIAGSPERSE